MCGSANVATSKPVGSGPNSNTSPGRYSTSANDRSACAVNANTRAPSTAAHAEDLATTRLFTQFEGKRCITPLFLVFLVIGSTDVLFAVDSIPAIMGISQEPFVVLTSNVFAVLGLNSLFFAIRGIMGMFKFLKHGVSIILFFIGAKMIAGIYHPVEIWFKEAPYVALLVIITVLAASIALSVWHDRQLKRKGLTSSTPPVSRET